MKPSFNHSNNPNGNQAAFGQRQTLTTDERHKFHFHDNPYPVSPLVEKSSGNSPTFKTILLLCDENNVKTVLVQFLEQEHYAVHSIRFEDLQNLTDNETYTAVLVDLGAKNVSVENLFTTLNKRIPDIPVILMDEPNQLPEYKDFCSRRAFSYLSKPCSRTDLVRDLKYAEKTARVIYENKQLRQSLGVPPQWFELYGLSSQYELLCKKLHTYIKLDGPILLAGERGTGKGVTAQHVHMSSTRAKHPLIVVPCDSFPSRALEAFLFGHVAGAIPDFPGERIGVLELAEHGTVYLDKINEMPFAVQARICQFLKDRIVQRIGSAEARIVDTRIIAGSNSDLALACLHARFHKELYYRLSSMLINLQPLREQVEDLPAFAKSMIARFAKIHQTSLPILSQGAVSKIQKYPWPGNVREMKAVIHQACQNAKDTVITEDDIIFDASDSEGRVNSGSLGLAGMTMAEIERRAIIETIHACGGNRAESARQLGVSEKTIYNKFRQFKLKGVV